MNTIYFNSLIYAIYFFMVFHYYPTIFGVPLLPQPTIPIIVLIPYFCNARVHTAIDIYNTECKVFRNCNPYGSNEALLFIHHSSHDMCFKQK